MSCLVTYLIQSVILIYLESKIMNANLTITSIKPTAGFFASKDFRAKEGEEKKQSLFASYEMPAEITSLHDSELKAFAIRAFGAAMDIALDKAIKDGKTEAFEMPSLADCFIATKREFLLTKANLMPWIDFAIPVISAAIAAKASLHIDSPKVVKKALAYKETLLALASRSVMKQEDIDACIKVCGLLEETGKKHDYTDNVLQGIVRAQDKLNAFLANGAQDDDGDELDF